MSDAPRSGKPYVWVTWITGLLAGSSRCEWSAWYKAHYKYEKVKDEDFDLDAWRAEHDRAVAARAAEFRAAGLTVGVESDNDFKLKGETAILSGKPDLTIMRGDTSEVRDIKTGNERESDSWQVKIYMFALARTGNRQWDGSLDYRGRIVVVQAPEVEEIKKLSVLMRLVGSATPPARVPSREECGRCDILHCPERNDSEPLEGATGEW